MQAKERGGEVRCGIRRAWGRRKRVGRRRDFVVRLGGKRQ